MRVYLDNCCYSRLFDDRSIINNYLEREAKLILLDLKLKGEMNLQIIRSDALSIEASRRKDPLRRQFILSLMSYIGDEYVTADDTILDNASDIRNHSKIKLFDSIHLALAENYADVLLTTDMRFLHQANKLVQRIRVMNPIDFLREVIAE